MEDDMSPENQIRLSMFVILLVSFTISGYYRRKANLSGGDELSTEEEGPLLKMRAIGGLLFYLSMLAFLVYPPLIAWAQVELPLGLRWTGVGLMALMVPLLYWMFSTLGNNITPTVATREAHQLITSGPYRYIRHPLYTFGTISFLGGVLAAANLLMLSAAVVGLWAIFMRTPIEERKLVEKFGSEYQGYMARTGRYLPKWK
jgi:protein-S-isoprenylcysteine O-methyltransferase Ste14